VGILISSPAGNDLPFDSGQCEQGRNFTNKVWNAYRLLASWEEKDFDQPESASIAANWFSARFNRVLEEINDAFDKFRISEALMLTYKLVWDDFCSWYLEMIKPGYEQPIDVLTKKQAISFFERLLQIMHPFTPFVAEELWHLIRQRKEGEDIIVSQWPALENIASSYLDLFEVAQEVITGIRNIRKSGNIATKVRLDLKVKRNNEASAQFDPIIIKMGNLSSLEYVVEKPLQANSFLVRGNEFYVPFGEEIDLAAERKKMEEELTYTKGFLRSVQSKLTNEKFMSGAPAQVVEMERKKENDALVKIKLLEEKIKELN